MELNPLQIAISNLRSLSKMLLDSNNVKMESTRVKTRHAGAYIADKIADELQKIPFNEQKNMCNWRLISTIPEYEKQTLVAGTYPGGLKYISKAHRNAQGEWVGFSIAPPTHWMPLPPHPDP